MIETRLAISGDLPDVATLAVRLMEEEGWPVGDDTHRLLLEDLCLRFGDGSNLTLVAYDGDVPVGMIQLRATWDAATDWRLEVFRLYVRPEYRHRGTGRRLIEAALDALPADQKFLVMISTVGALRPSYRRMGFETVSQVHAAPISRIRAALRRN